MERRLFPLVAVGNQATEQVDQEISHAPVPGMFDLEMFFSWSLMVSITDRLRNNSWSARGSGGFFMFLRLGVISSRPWASSWSKSGWER